MNEITAFFAFLRYSLGKKENMSRGDGLYGLAGAVFFCF